MQFLNFAEYLAQPIPKETWIVKDILSIGGMSTIYGKPKRGKSWAALGMAIAVSQGHSDWLGFSVQTHGPVAYVQLDVSKAMWFADYLTPIAPFIHDPTTFVTVDREMAPRPFNIFGTGGQALKTAIAALPSPPILTIIDTMRKVHTGDENESGHTEHVLAAIVDAIPQSALLIVSHARKGGPMVAEDVLDDVRGSTAFTGAVDAIIKLQSSKPREKGVLLYEGRTNVGRQPLRRHPSGLWLPVEDHEAVIREVLEEQAGESQNTQAEAVAARLNISHSTAVRKIREVLQKGGV